MRVACARGIECRQQLGCGQAHLVADPVIAGDRQARLGSGTRVDLGQQLGCGQAYLVANAAIAGDGAEGIGCAARIVSGQVLCRGHAVVVGVVVHGCNSFLCEEVCMRPKRTVLLDVLEDLLHLVELLAELGELHVDLGELQVGVLLSGDGHL